MTSVQLPKELYKPVIPVLFSPNHNGLHVFKNKLEKSRYRIFCFNETGVFIYSIQVGLSEAAPAGRCWTHQIYH